jgi:hypothetical protein
MLQDLFVFAIRFFASQITVKVLLVSLTISLLAGGCVEQEPPLQIDSNYHSPTVQIPTIKPTVKPAVSTAPVAEWVPPPYLERQWTAIIIHHSGTPGGSAAIFDKWHREGNHWAGVGYDFVIGNGRDVADGLVETTFRWREQKAGAHCGGTPDNWANEKGIGICLVGDFNRAYPTERQMQSLVQLVRFLQNRYNIPAGRIYGHGTTPGARTTDCPGRNFPMFRLKSML